MKIGFTGTQAGMTQPQQQKVKALFRQLGITELHHGDCIGADAHAHAIGRELGVWIVSHPPTNPGKRAFCDADMVLPAKDYLARNRDIVDATVVLVAAPKTMQEELRSGTWATLRYSRWLQKKRFVVYPDGSVGKEEFAMGELFRKRQRISVQAPIADYDRHHDVLYVSYGPPRPGYGDPDDDNDMLIWRFDTEDKAMGFTVINYSRLNKAELIAKLRERGLPGEEVLP